MDKSFANEEKLRSFMVKFWPWYIIITQIKICTETSDNAYMQDFASSLMHDWLQSASESKKCQLFPPFQKFLTRFLSTKDFQIG